MPPEVIDLLSSTPPAPSNPREPSSIRRFRSSPPALADAHSIPLLSDDIDLDLAQFTNDGADDLDKPPKRRRLTPEIDTATKSPRGNDNLLPPRNRSHFVFSDEIVPSSDGPSNAQSKRPAFTLDSDPIVFTSSAPELAGRNASPEKRDNQQATTKSRAIQIDDDSDNGNDFGRGGPQRHKHPWGDDIDQSSDTFNAPDPSEIFNIPEKEVVVPGLRSELSGRTASLLASLTKHAKDDASDAGARTKQKSRGRRGVSEELRDPDELPEPRGGRKPKKATTNKPATADKEAKAKEREAAKAQRDREKQLEKERKQKMREEKAKDKQFAAEIADVNKLKVEKKNSTPEMIIDLSSSFKETGVGNQALEYMRALGVEYSFFDSSFRNLIKWRRKMKATYNKALGYWEPCELHIQEEEHVLYFLTAQEFVEMAASSVDPDTPNAPSDLEVHVLRLKSAHPRCTVIYLIEGLTAWMRKSANARNRAYQAEFRRNLEEAQGPSTTASTSAPSRRKKSNKSDSVPQIDDDTIEDALLNLQVTHNCLIHQTAAPPETAEWIKIFTEHISTIPYRRERMEDNDSAFCMESGQVKPGEDAFDSYIRMLQEVSRVTASMAYGVARQHPTVVDLIRGMRGSGPGMLEDVKVSLLSFSITFKDFFFYLTHPCIEISKQEWRCHGFPHRSCGKSTFVQSVHGNRSAVHGYLMLASKPGAWR